MRKLLAAAAIVASVISPAVLPTMVLGASVPLNQLSMDAVPDLSSEGVRKVQSLLKNKGFDPGAIDGVVGVRTEAALRAFQEQFAIKASGHFDNQTLFALGAVDLAGQPGN